MSNRYKQSRRRRMRIVAALSALAVSCLCVYVAWAQERTPQDDVLFAEEQLQDADSQLQQIEGRLPPLLDSISQLQAEIQSLEELEAQPPQPEEPETRKELFRLPMISVSSATQTTAIVVEDNRVTVADSDPVLIAALEQIERLPQRQGIVERTVNVDSGHFNAWFKVNVDPRYEGQLRIGNRTFTLRISEYPEIAFVRKAGHPGEELDQIDNPLSEIGEILNGRARRNLLQFAVYPDSYEAFRKIRGVSWDKGFEVRWIPLASGDPVRIGGASSLTKD